MLSNYVTERFGINTSSIYWNLKSVAGHTHRHTHKYAHSIKRKQKQKTPNSIEQSITRLSIELD